ncbi:hypothetical protein O6H91_15G080400 [Diphasiastrum complanatum]|uniref:Uncharacterized protein n=1 Tax=Diphasiastrum complanatum TaxID=34168 RepID=A0ACC2BK17_DIPCM|nr:hypothetical protein O6H91_15G080400 [Diphasiastrum complanatum]
MTCQNGDMPEDRDQSAERVAICLTVSQSVSATAMVVAVASQRKDDEQKVEWRLWGCLGILFLALSSSFFVVGSLFLGFAWLCGMCMPLQIVLSLAYEVFAWVFLGKEIFYWLLLGYMSGYIWDNM